MQQIKLNNILQNGKKNNNNNNKLKIINLKLQNNNKSKLIIFRINKKLKILINKMKKY